MRDISQYYSFDEINKMARDDVILAGSLVRFEIIKILMIIPKKVLGYILENCLFVILPSEQKGVFINNKLIDKKNVIVFEESIDQEPMESKSQIVIHEIAHHVLNHEPIFETQNQEDILRIKEERENEANELAYSWIKDYPGSEEWYLLWGLTSDRLDSNSNY